MPSSKFNFFKRRYLSGFIFKKIASRNEIGKQSVNAVRDLTVGWSVPYQTKSDLFVLRALSIRRADVLDKLAIQSGFVTKLGELRADFSDKTRESAKSQT